MEFGGTLKAVVVGAAIAGGAGLFSGSQKTTQDAKQSLADMVNQILKNPKIQVAQSGAANSKSVNRGDGNSFMSPTTYHSYTWDYCEKWVGTDLCEKWLDPYVSDHGFGSQQSALEGKVAQLYAANRDTKTDSQWAIWDIAVKGGQQAQDEYGRLNRKALSKFELREDIKNELRELGRDAALDLLAGTVGKDEPKETMPSMEGLRAIAGNLTVAYRNNLVGLLGGLWRNTEGVEVPGGENYTGCEAIMNEQNSEETDEKLYRQGPLAESTRNIELEKRIQLCRQLMSQSVRMVNPQVQGDQIVSGDPNTEQIDQWRIRANIELMDDLGKNASEITKPADATLTEKDVASEIVVNENGKETVMYELPKDQIEAYNAMLEKAAKSQEAVAKTTIGHIPDDSRAILSNKLKDSVSAVEINGLSREMKEYFKGEKVNTIEDFTPEMTPQELIQTAGQ